MFCLKLKAGNDTTVFQFAYPSNSQSIEDSLSYYFGLSEISPLKGDSLIRFFIYGDSAYLVIDLDRQNYKAKVIQFLAEGNGVNGFLKISKIEYRMVNKNNSWWRSLDSLIMKRILFVLFTCFFISANGQVENDIMQLIKEDNTVFIDTSILLVSDTNRKVGLREHGVWRFRNGGDLLDVSSYYGGVLHGQVINFLYNRIINSMYYYNGIKHGPCVNYWYNGNPKYQMFYKEGKLSGIAKDFDTTGRLEKIVTYKDGKKEGMEVSLYPSGNIKYLKNYVNGKENGIRKVYRDTAVLELIAEYVVENGKVISEKIYDKEALPIEIPLKIDGNVYPEGNQ